MPRPEPPSGRPEEPPSWLFAYGTLGPRPGDGLGWAPDAIRGRLFDLGPYPALIDLDDPTAGWVEGYVRPVDCDELEHHLDPYEGVDEGLYRRLPATTRHGRRAWVYVYAQHLPASARGPIPRWHRPR